MNNVISKQQAIEKAIELFSSERNEFTNLYISQNILSYSQMKDYAEELIFKDVKEDTFGWLFLFDLMPFANWSHDCKYLLVIDDCNYKIVKHNKGASDSTLLEKVY